MSVRAIEAEVSIKSGVQAECTIGREVIRTVYDEPVLESLSVTENGLYEPSEGIDGYSDVTVNVPGKIPVQDPNVIEGEFTGTEGGVLTIDLPYTGDSYPKAVFIYDAEGIIEEDVPRAYTMTAYCAFKNNAQEPTYDGDTSNNGFRYQVVYTGTVTYTSTAGSPAYVFSQADPVLGNTNAIKMPDSKTLKVYISSSTASSAMRFRAGIRYKYRVYY